MTRTVVVVQLWDAPLTIRLDYLPDQAVLDRLARSYLSANEGVLPDVRLVQEFAFR